MKNDPLLLTPCRKPMKMMFLDYLCRILINSVAFQSF